MKKQLRWMMGGTKLSDDGKTLYLTFSRGTTILLR